MNITQIKYVLAVAKFRSMREAAGKLYVSQPTLSTSIRELEEEIGISIFERSNKGVSLTKEGREFTAYAKMALSQYSLLEEMYLSKTKVKEHFSVSTQHYHFAIRSFTNMIRETDPEKYVFTIHEKRTEEVMKNVREMESEVGIVSYAENNKKIIHKLFREYGLKFVPLMLQENYVYLWKNHPLAGAEYLSIEDLKPYPCVFFDQNADSDFYFSEEAMAELEFEKLIKTADRAAAFEIIETLNACAIGSGMISEKDAILKGIVSVKLKEEDPLTIGYIVRKEGSLSHYGELYIEELNKYRKI